MRGRGAAVDAVIIGAQKAGSTSLQAGLSAHPAIYAPGGEDPVFERQDLNEAQRQAHLERRFRGAHDRVRLLKRPNYLGLDGPASRLFSVAPNCRLLVMLREPRERAVSAYVHYQRFGFLPAEPVAEGLAKVFAGDYDAQYARAAEVREFGLYAAALTRWSDVFPREQLLVVTFESFKIEPRAVFDRACAFLGVQQGQYPSALFERANEGAYSPDSMAAYQTVNDVFFRYSEGRMTRRLRPSLSPAKLLKGVSALSLARSARQSKSAKPVLPNDLAARISDYYAHDLARLEKDWGISFGAPAMAPHEYPERQHG